MLSEFRYQDLKRLSFIRCHVLFHDRLFAFRAVAFPIYRYVAGSGSEIHVFRTVRMYYMASETRNVESAPGAPPTDRVSRAYLT